MTELVRASVVLVAAAALALACRGAALAAAGRALDPLVHDLAALGAPSAPDAASAPEPGPPGPPGPPASSQPTAVPSLVPGPPKPMRLEKLGMAPTAAAHPAPPLPGGPSSAGARFEIASRELEEAIASGMAGTSVRRVLDAEGHAAGFAIDRVGRLARFGVRAGDVLVSANQMPLATANDALAALGALEHTRVVTIVLRRDGVSYAVRLEFA